ncbi:sensor histidine kinase [Nocardia takedensis]|uniref:sensor histidine kinase n=1 Tax=Nocardia takedensis TaxID=259390 RepID=UPI003F758C85
MGSRGSAEAGKAAFDALRTRFDTQNVHLESARAHARDQVAHSRGVRDAVLGGSVLALLFTMAILTVMIRGLVVAPLRALETASRRVAGGEFSHRIPVHGPADVATVGAAVEQMRERVVTELAGSRATEAELARRAAQLDAQTTELRRSNTELEQFAYVASHDLQEPLRKVASFCQMLAKRYGDRLDDRGRQYIDYAVDGAKRMQILINDLLTFSRLGRTEPGNAPTATLDQALDTALTDLAPTIEASGAIIQRPAVMPSFTGEASLLTMVWQNLLANAVKFARPDVNPEITIDADTDHDAGGTEVVSISLRDNDIGIEPEHADKVFVIFQRLHNRTEYEGTGIGLAICRKIIEYHGGHIRVDPTHTDGARIVFTLPTTRLQPDRDS